MKNKFNEVVIVAAGRTPIGTYKGLLKNIKADQLGSIVIREIINRAKIKAEDINEVILGITNVYDDHMDIKRAVE